jgi:ATP-dependent Clp protease adaptor protein ClpS
MAIFRSRYGFQEERRQQDESDVLEVTRKERSLVLHNDDFNTFEWVIETLMDVCQHSSEQAEQCAYIVHHNGKCEVKRGPHSILSKMHIALIQRGLTATVE